MAPQTEELGMQLQKEKASSQHLETLNEELEEDLEQWFNIIHTLRAHRAAQVGPPERMPPLAPCLPEGVSRATAVSWSLISDSWVTSSLA